MSIISEAHTIRSLLEARAEAQPRAVYLSFHGEGLSFGTLNRQVNALANGLLGIGVQPGQRIAVMLPNHPDAVITFYALTKLRVTQVPVNIHLAGQSLAFLLNHSEPHLIIADQQYRDILDTALKRPLSLGTVWRNIEAHEECDFHALLSSGDEATPPGECTPQDVVSILYTSGTTGPPKGVLVTDKMHRACAYSSAIVADVKTDDVMYLWEPLYHVGGTEVLLVGLQHQVRLALTERFSVTRFWDEVCAAGATHIHYLGGILQMLLRQPTRRADTRNPVRVAWGGGAPVAVWEPFAERFQVRLRENYGMTETSSLTSFNTDGKHGSVGRPAPYFDVEIATDSGHRAAAGVTGEICVREKESGLVTAGYFRNPEATHAAFRDGWFHTGDLGYLDETGYLYYAGRLKDRIRRRGENISTWQIERVVEQVDWVEECAVIGVPDEIDDEMLKLFVKPVAGRAGDAASIFQWCEEQLSKFEVPQLIEFVDDFPKTATQRIKKEALSQSRDTGWCHGGDGTVRYLG